MKIVALDHIQIAMPKGQEEEARAFYQGLLGITEVPKPGDLSARGGAWFENGNIKIHLGVEDDFRPAEKAHPALVVSDLDQLLTTLRNNGYGVTDDHNLPGIKRAFSHDPFGNRIEFIHCATNRI